MCQSNQNLNLPPPPFLATHGYFTVVCAWGGREFLSVPGGGGGGREFEPCPGGTFQPKVSRLSSVVHIF